MRTRRGISYPRRGVAVNACNTAAEKRTSSTTYNRGKPDFTAGEYMVCRKRNRLVSTGKKGETDLFESLPDDLVISILCKLSSSASCPSDFINVLITCVPFLLSLSLWIFLFCWPVHLRFDRKRLHFCYFDGANREALFSESSFWLKLQVQEIKWIRPSFTSIIQSFSEIICNQSQQLVRFCSPFPQALCRCRKCWSLLHSWHGNY